VNGISSGQDAIYNEFFLMLAKISQINYLAQGFFLCLVFSIVSKSMRVHLMTEWNGEKSLFLLSGRKKHINISSLKYQIQTKICKSKNTFFY